MDQFLVALALVLQTADAGLTCHRLACGGYERNPLLPKTCGRIVLMKAALTAPVFIFRGRNQRIWAVAMSASGGVGLTLTLRSR